MKKSSSGIPYLLFIMLLVYGCKEPRSEHVLQNKPDTAAQNRKLWLKQYALCNCIKYGFHKDTAVWNDPSSSVLREISDFNDPVIYAIVDSSAAKAVSNVKPLQVADYNQKKAILSDCINYYESKMLDSLIERIDKVYRAREEQINK